MTKPPPCGFSTDAYGNTVYRPKYNVCQMPTTIHRSADRSTIDPVDGKTRQCNRSLTFDSFLDERHLGEDKPQKRVGHGWELWRGVSKVVRKASRRRRERKKGDYVNMDDGSSFGKPHVARAKTFG